MNFVKFKESSTVSMPPRLLRSGPNSPWHQIPSAKGASSAVGNAHVCQMHIHGSPEGKATNSSCSCSTTNHADGSPSTSAHLGHRTQPLASNATAHEASNPAHKHPQEGSKDEARMSPFRPRGEQEDAGSKSLSPFRPFVRGTVSMGSPALQRARSAQRPRASSLRTPTDRAAHTLNQAPKPQYSRPSSSSSSSSTSEELQEHLMFHCSAQRFTPHAPLSPAPAKSSSTHLHATNIADTPTATPTTTTTTKKRSSSRPRYHRLQSVWSLWWHDKDAVTPHVSYRKQLKKLGTFRTLESFARIYGYLKAPTTVKEGVHFHLFKGSKAPCWERYPNGGMFVLSFDIEHADEAWERACFAAIGLALVAPCFQGLACAVRENFFYLQCWYKEAPLEDVQDLRTQLLHAVHHQMTCPVRIVERVFT